MREQLKRDIIRYHQSSMSMEETAQHFNVRGEVVARLISVYRKFGETMFTDDPVPIWMQNELKFQYQISGDLKKAADKVSCDYEAARFVLFEVMKLAC